MWHQLDEVLSLSPQSVLEIGPGPGIFKAVATSLGVNVETVDLDPELNPDYVSSATELPFPDNHYDCVCAFQMLEHLPYNQSILAFKEMVRVAKKHIIISLPDAKRVWPYSFYIPKIGEKFFHIPKPRLLQKKHLFDGEHYWEINKKGYPLKKIFIDLKKNNVTLLKTYRVNEFSYHRFFVFQKAKQLTSVIKNSQ